MTDTVQVPREATSEMIGAGWGHVTVALSNGQHDALHDLYRAMIAAAPQATDPRDANDQKVIAWANNSLFGSHSYFLSLTGGEPDEQHLARAIEELKEIARKRYAEIERLKARRECHLSTMGALAMDRDIAESRLATLTAERDALREALTSITNLKRERNGSWASSGLVLDEAQTIARRALSTQPSKTETRDD